MSSSSVRDALKIEVPRSATFVRDDAAPPSGHGSRPRIAIFTHDAYGVGHVRRCLRIAHAIAERAPGAAILLVTGSSAVDALGSLPANADHVKVPTVVTSGARACRPPMLNVGLAEITFLRERLILETCRSFTPDVFLVDNFPLGSQRELLATLHELRRQSTRLVLGVRDVLDPPELVRRDWTRQGVYDVLERYYDRVLVYGAREVFDIAEAYALPSAIADKVEYCGYVTDGRPAIRPEAEVRAELAVEGPFILATVGGGGDGLPLLETVLEALPLLPEVPAVLVAGHLMAPGDRTKLRALAADRPSALVLDRVADLPSYLAAADVVVAMGGYNTAAEILSVRARAVVVPRTWRSGEHGDRSRARVDAEQLVRAQSLARLGLVDVLEPAALTAEALAERITAALAAGRPRLHDSVELCGVGRAADAVLAMAHSRNGLSSVPR